MNLRLCELNRLYQYDITTEIIGQRKYNKITFD